MARPTPDNPMRDYTFALREDQREMLGAVAEHNFTNRPEILRRLIVEAFRAMQKEAADA